MILRDINNSKADFSAFLYDLHTNLKANPDPSRAQLGQLVARALGARSQAALPHLDTPSKQTFIAAPKTAASHKNLFFWTARNGLTPTIIDGKLVSVPLKQLLVDGIPPPCSKKRHAPTLVKHSEALCALDEGDHKRTAWARIYDANNINCKVVKSFARDLNLTPGELEEKYSKGSNHYPFLGLTYTLYWQECDYLATSISYWDWVALKLSELGTSPSIHNPTRLEYYYIGTKGGLSPDVFSNKDNRSKDVILSFAGCKSIKTGTPFPLFSSKEAATQAFTRFEGKNASLDLNLINVRRFSATHNDDVTDFAEDINLSAHGLRVKYQHRAEKLKKAPEYPYLRADVNDWAIDWIIEQFENGEEKDYWDWVHHSIKTFLANCVDNNQND